jgi:hypothetical protein
MMVKKQQHETCASCLSLGKADSEHINLAAKDMERGAAGSISCSTLVVSQKREFSKARTTVRKLSMTLQSSRSCAADAGLLMRHFNRYKKKSSGSHAV